MGNTFERLVLVVALVVATAIGAAWFIAPRLLDGPDLEEVPRPAIESARKPTVEESLVETQEEPLVPPTPPPPRPVEPVTTSAWVLDGAIAYDGPGLNRPVLARLDHGQRVRWIKTQDGWDHIYLPGRVEAWMPANQLAFTRPPDVEDDGPEQAIQTVQSFYVAINERDYVSAYRLLSPEWQKGLEFESFARGYASTHDCDCRVENVEVLDPGTVKVNVFVACAEVTGNVRYKGYYVVELYGGEWVLRQGVLETVRSISEGRAPRSPPR